MGLFDQTYDQQLSAIQRRQTYDAQVAAAAGNANPQVAANVAAQSQAYPHLSPQTVYALGANGNTPGDQLSQTVATAALNKKGGGFWHSLGHVVTAPFRTAMHLAAGAAGDIGDVAQPLVRAGLTAAETPLQIGMGTFRDVASGAGDIVAGAVAGAGTGAATAGIAGGTLGSIIPGLGNVVGALGGVVGGAVIGGIAGAGAGALAQTKGVQVQGGFVNPISQSTGGLAIQSLLGGKDVSLGSGWLPAGQIRDQQIKNAEAAASINGHALTPGRLLASSVARPGTTAYNVLSGVTDAVDTWQLDPAKHALEDVGAARKAAKIIPGAATDIETAGLISRTVAARAGLLDSADPAVALDKAQDFLRTDGAARRFITKAAETDSASTIRAASNGKLPVAIANQLAAATSEQDIERILLNAVAGGDLKEKAAIQAGRGITSTLTSVRPAARLTQTMDRLGSVLPDRSVDLVDIDRPGGAQKLSNAVDQMDRWLTQARYTTTEKTPILDRLMTATTADEARTVFTDTMQGDMVNRLKTLGHDDQTISRFVGRFKADEKLLTDHLVGELGDATTPRSLNIGGDDIPLSPANQLLEHTAYTVKLPDPTELRRLTTPRDTVVGKSLSALYNSDGWKNSVSASESLMGRWKSLNIIRPALVTRVLARSQAMAAANGLETGLSDPANLFRMIFNPELRPQLLEGAAEGDVLSKAEAYQRFASRSALHLNAEDTAPFQTILRPGEDGFPEAWSARIAELHADPVARTVAGQGVEATKNAFWDGPLAAERERLIGDGNNLLADRAAADNYIEQNIGGRLSKLTADNPHLLDAIATGEIRPTDLDGNPIGDAIPLLKEHPGGLINPDVAPHLESMAVDPQIEVPVEIPAAKKVVDADYGKKVSQVTRWFYSKLIDAPQETLFRSPEYNQLYWRNIADQTHLLDEEGVAALRSRLADDTAKISIPDDTKARLDKALSRPSAGQGAVQLQHLDELAKYQAADGLADMTLNMAQRTGWQQSMRLMSPFAGHWQQELTQWAKTAADNPNVVRQAQMTVQGAIGSGFFHKDDYGNYVFNYPGTGLIGRVLGMPGGLQASAAGLSPISTAVVPGVGPLASIAASKLLPNTPDFDEIRNFLAPYGDPTSQGVLDSALPSWAKTVKDALADPNHNRDTANTTMQVARYLVSTGKFSTDTPEAQQELLKEAGSRARRLLLLQAVGKLFSPSSPKLEAVAQIGAKAGVTDGRTVVAKLLSDDLQKMRNEDYDTSADRFLTKYGDQAMLFLQASSRPVVPGAATTKEQDVYARANPDVVGKLPNTYAFFAPQGAQTPDYMSTIRQIHSGERQALTPKQQVLLANDQVASMQYYQIKDALGPRVSTAQQALLSQFKDALMQQYPGFGQSIPGLAARATDNQGIQTTVIPELQRGLQDPKIAGTDTGKALSQYLELRDVAMTAAQSRGLKPTSFATSTQTADLRALLRQAATLLSANNTGFSLLFDRVLGNELKTDTAPVPASA